MKIKKEERRNPENSKYCYQGEIAVRRTGFPTHIIDSRDGSDPSDDALSPVDCVVKLNHFVGHDLDAIDELSERGGTGSQVLGQPAQGIQHIFPHEIKAITEVRGVRTGDCRGVGEGGASEEGVDHIVHRLEAQAQGPHARQDGGVHDALCELLQVPRLVV